MLAGVWKQQGATSMNPWAGLKNTEYQLKPASVGSQQYDAFGNVVASTGWTASPNGYGGPFGYQEDPDSGLKLLGHRYYDPDLGRFLSRDPIQDGRNWYVYCDSNPVKWVDPPGLTPRWWAPGSVENRQDPRFPTVIVIGVGDFGPQRGHGFEPDFFPISVGEKSGRTVDIDYVILIDPETGAVGVFKLGGGFSKMLVLSLADYMVVDGPLRNPFNNGPQSGEIFPGERPRYGTVPATELIDQLPKKYRDLIRKDSKGRPLT